uniref:Uncharacterized protein n=1 Tax=Desertifilum tharense IPPAS B-1220 TaxID=1781255 RepID=A0ACD5GR21_9CYAN
MNRIGAIALFSTTCAVVPQTAKPTASQIKCDRPNQNIKGRSLSAIELLYGLFSRLASPYP